MSFVKMGTAHADPQKGPKLNWNFKLNLVASKVVDPMIHICELCERPILVYGRMIPCKHVFCFECANIDRIEGNKKVCPRCHDPIVKVERCNLGQIYMCTQGASRHSKLGCRRTYLSGRDLNAHVAHRHSVTKPHHRSSASNSDALAQQQQQPKVSSASVAADKLQPPPMPQIGPMSFPGVGPPPVPPMLAGGASVPLNPPQLSYPPITAGLPPNLQQPPNNVLGGGPPRPGPTNLITIPLQQGGDGRQQMRMPMPGPGPGPYLQRPPPFGREFDYNSPLRGAGGPPPPPFHMRGPPPMFRPRPYYGPR